MRGTKSNTLGGSKGMKYFEDFEVGNIETSGEYLVTKDEIVEFASKWDPQPFHINEEFAASSIFQQVVACGPHTYAISCRLAHMREEEIASVAGLGIDEMRFLNPVRPGDIITLVSECLEKRPSGTKPGHGILKMRVQLLNQNRDLLFSFTNTFLVLMRQNEQPIVHEREDRDNSTSD